MIITCPECDTRYRYDERRFDGAASKQVKCTSCGFTFEAENPALEPKSVQQPTDAGSEPAAARIDDPVTDWSSRQPDVDQPTPPPVEPKPTPEVDREAPIPPLPTDPRYSLAVIAGGQAGTVFQIHKPRIFLGRGSAMDIQLRDSEVSRRHAVLEIRDPEVSLMDLGSTNGTWFDGAQIDTATLGHQDEFTLGSTTLMLIVTPMRDG